MAIGGNLADLASKRGQIGDYVSSGSFDFNREILDTKNVFFGHTGSTNMPFPGSSAVQVKSRGYADYKWIAYLAQNCGYIASPRAAIKSSFTEDGGVTYATAGWSKLLDEKHVGDGITVNNGIISVPEYEGATASKAGTSGLVPPAAAGQQESFLTGGGEYKPALTKISDNVSLEDSTTAASAKAVKTAYELANGKQAALGFTPVQQGGGANQRPNKVYLGWDGGAVRMQVDNTDMGQLVTTLAGQQKAPNAAWADGAQFALRLRREGNVDTIWNWAGQGGQPGWLWGGNDGVNMYVYNPANFSVNYANSAYISTAVSGVWFGRNNQTVPSGGTWRVITSINGKIDFMTVAGGTSIPHDWWYAVRVA